MVEEPISDSGDLEDNGLELREEQEQHEFEELMEIGDSPVPGMTVRQVLRGHTSVVNSIAWSPDTTKLASASNDQSIRIWDTKSWECVKILYGPAGVDKVNWSPNGNLLASSFEEDFLDEGGKQYGIHIWDTNTWDQVAILGKNMGTEEFTWSPNGETLLSFSKGLNVWNWKTATVIHKVPLRRRNTDERGKMAYSVKWMTDKKLGIGFYDGLIGILDTNNWTVKLTPHKHNDAWPSLAWSENRKALISGAHDNVIKIWSTDGSKQVIQLEGHTKGIVQLALSGDDRLLASKSWDETIRIWQLDKLKTAAILTARTHQEGPVTTCTPALSFHPKLNILATVQSANSTSIAILEFDINALLRNSVSGDSVRYTTAKLVLVGDSGVGKTGLGWRLAHNEFKEHSSTHGQQFWVVPELKKARDDGTECEAVLWDLAGQHIYRSIHSIFLDDVDASLVMFDPTNRQEPLKGAQFWLEQLKGKKQLPPSVLVGARLDRGASVLSQQELEQFCQKYGISGGYVGTSAKSGEGLDRLLETLKSQIPWDQMTTTVTTITFKKIKDYVLALKEKPDRQGVLVRPDELRHQLEATDKDWQFTNAEMMTAVSHLANHGYVTVLKSSSGEEYILLVPELLASVAASIFLQADKHPRELGALNETELLQGKYPIEEFKGLENEEQQVLLDATVVRFLGHNICFREAYDNGNLLIFPSLIKQKRPLKDDVPATDDVSYMVRGRVENIYASLVVLLGYTPSFSRINQWANQAQYETDKGNICGFRLVEDREGEIELILYYDNEMEEKERNAFQALFEQFLYKRDAEVTPFPPVACPNGHRQERATVVKRLREGKKSIFCDECGAPTQLPDLEGQPAYGFEVPQWLKREEAIARLRGLYETHLVNVKGYRRDWAPPRCYISHVDEQNELAEKLAHDMADAGIFIIKDVAQVDLSDNIILIDSEAYKKAWESNDIPKDIKQVKQRLTDGKRKGLIPINISGPILKHSIEECKPRFFHDPTHYVVNLFDLILNLYAIPLNHAGFMPLRKSLHTQWEQTLAQKVKWERVSEEIEPINNKEIFISYAWGGESEKLVNELDQAFQERSVTIIRDKRDLGFKGRIKTFMETIGKGKAVILIISEKYLKSENCLFELLQIAKHGEFTERIFPVVMDDARIYKAMDRIRYVQYWEKQLKDLDKAIRSVSATNLDGFREDIDLYAEIRANLPRLTDILKDMNTLTSTIHRDEEFQTLFDAIMAKLEE
jgi:small GTP-binding protein